MKPETLTALRASIAHHEENLKVKTPRKVDLSPKSCALCALFFKDGCDGCPVAERSGRARCVGTPYRELDCATYWWRMTRTSAERNAFLTAERAEIAFLRSLLPEGEK